MKKYIGFPLAIIFLLLGIFKLIAPYIWTNVQPDAAASLFGISVPAYSIPFLIAGILAFASDSGPGQQALIERIKPFVGIFSRMLPVGYQQPPPAMPQVPPQGVIPTMPQVPPQNKQE